MTKRNSFNQTEPFKDRLAAFPQDARTAAASLPSGIERDDLLRKARQSDTASHLEEWCNSQELQPPK
jgi:hypothetical protein